MIDVGTVFAVEEPVGVNVRLFVRLICNPPVAPVGTVITTGDQPPEEAGFNAAQVAPEPDTVVPQLYPHIGTAEPSGKVAVTGPAVKLTCC
jgi:hypothetical protein